MSNVGIANSRYNYTLTLGILAIVIPIIGLIFGVMGVLTSNKLKAQKQEAGYNKVKAGLVFSVIGIIIQLLMIVGVVTFYMY